MFTLKVSNYRKKSYFRRRSGYRSPVETCRKPRCTSQWRIRLVKNFEKFSKSHKNFIFEKLQFFWKSKEIWRQNTRFQKNFQKIPSTLIFIAISILAPVLWRHQASNPLGPLTTGPKITKLVVMPSHEANWSLC